MDNLLSTFAFDSNSVAKVPRVALRARVTLFRVIVVANPHYEQARPRSVTPALVAFTGIALYLFGYWLLARPGEPGTPAGPWIGIKVRLTPKVQLPPHELN